MKFSGNTVYHSGSWEGKARKLLYIKSTLTSDVETINIVFLWGFLESEYQYVDYLFYLFFYLCHL